MHPAELDSRRGWLVTAAAATSMFAVFGVGYSFGAFFTSMAEEFDAGTSTTALVFSLTISFSFFVGMWTGRLTDRIGPRPVLLMGAASLTTGLLLTTVVPSITLGYITYGLGVGFAIACGYVPMVATVGSWFEKRRSAALGIAVAGIGLGTLVGSPLAAALIDRTSWRTTYVIFAIGGGALLVLASLVADHGPAHVPSPGHQPLRTLLKRPRFTPLYISITLVSYGIFIPFVFLARYAEQRNIDPVAAAALIGIIGGSSVLGRLGLGALADRLGALNLFWASLIVLSASHAIWLTGADRYPQLVVYAVIFGVGYGGFIALSAAVSAELFGMDGLGGLIGTLYTAAGIGGLTGPPIAGALIDSINDTAGILFALIMSSLGTLVLTRLRTTHSHGSSPEDQRVSTVKPHDP